MSTTLHHVDGIAVITIDRPGRANALSHAVIGELVAHLGAVEAPAVVLTGAGGWFSGGADLDDLRADAGRLQADLGVLRDAVLDVPMPVVAAIEGACVGGGLELAVTCDVRISGAGATFGIPAARLGVTYPEGGMALLRRRLPHQTLSRLFLLAETIPAAEAVEAGIVARVVPAGDAVEAAIDLARSASGLIGATVAETKARLRI